MFRKTIYKILVTSIFIVFGSLIINKSDNVKNIIYDNIYNNYINLASIKNTYNTYFGNIIPFENIIKDEKVFNEKLKYKNISKYNNGVKLELSNNLVTSLSSGIVVFIGDKDDFNKTVIIENKNGVEEWYGNLDSINVKLYDYISKGDIIGNTNNNLLYLEFIKDNKYLDYKKFL